MINTLSSKQDFINYMNQIPNKNIEVIEKPKKGICEINVDLTFKGLLIVKFQNNFIKKFIKEFKDRTSLLALFKVELKWCGFIIKQFESIF